MIIVLKYRQFLLILNLENSLLANLCSCCELDEFEYNLSTRYKRPVDQQY